VADRYDVFPYRRCGRSGLLLPAISLGAWETFGGYRAAEVALAEAKPSGDNAFKIDLASRVVACALALAAAGTPERMPALAASPLTAVSGVLTHA